MDTTMSQSNDETGGVQILNEADVKVVTRSQPHSIPASLEMSTSVGYDQMSIRDFLAKPYRFSSFTWNTSDPRGSSIFSTTLPKDVFTSNDVYAKKVFGFLGFKATAVVRIQVNANKFQAGRLLAVFIPQGGVAYTYPAMRLRSLMSATQLPRVELDIDTETEVIMEIPYISPTPYYNLLNEEGMMGQFDILVYSPLVVGLGSPAVDVTIWVHFKDVELVTPALVPQMSSRRPRRVNVSEAELTASGDKPISGGLRNLAKAAESFSQIPLLTKFAAPASWVLNCMSGAASAFGYSKPGSETAITKVVPMFNFNAQNHNGVDIFPNMGMEASNKVTLLPGLAGTDVDETSLLHLVQIPAYIRYSSWTDAQPEDALLASFNINPMVGTDLSTLGTWRTADLTPVAFFSNFFTYWRGSLVLTIKVVKTQFHSGRLLISYNPFGTALPTPDQTNYLLREVLDIRETKEFKFIIPFASTRHYRTVPQIFSEWAPTEQQGVVTVRVLNELVQPNTAPQGVELLFELSAGPDFELALPRPGLSIPITNSAWSPQMGEVVPSTKDSSRPDRNQEATAIGESMVPPPSLDPAAYCMGEKVNSVMQLLKRFSLVLPTGTLTEGAAFSSLNFRPFRTAAIFSSSTTLPNSLCGDLYATIAPCFAYSRGAIRIMVKQMYDYDSTFAVNPAVGGMTGSVFAYPDPSTVDITDDNDPQDLSWLSVNWQPMDVAIPVGATVPAFNPLHARLNRLTNLEPTDIYTSSMRVMVKTNWGTTPNKVNIYRAVGDDFQLGYFVGVPLMASRFDRVTPP